MLSWHFIKKSIIPLSLIVLTMGFLVLGWFAERGQTKIALALPGSVADGWIPLRGWAWSDTVGWLDFNYKSKGGYCVNAAGETNNQKCDNDSVCPSGYTCGYWVAVNQDNGVLGGYAWSYNVGWVSFTRTGFCNDDYRRPCEGSSQCPIGEACNLTYSDPPEASGCPLGAWACYKADEQKFYGWGRVLSLASASLATDAGWVKLNPAVAGVDYGLRVVGPVNDSNNDQLDDSNGLPIGGAPWGDIAGWAWNGASQNQGLGWFSANCQNTDTCAASNYKLSGRPDDIAGVQLQRADGQDSHSLKLSWTTPTYAANLYEIWRQDNAGVYNRVLSNFSGDNYKDINLDLFTNYAYVVRACNVFSCSRSGVVALRTSPIDDTTLNLQATAICSAPVDGQSFVDLAWGRPDIVEASGVNLTAYEIQYCQTDVNKGQDCADWHAAAAACNNVTDGALSCREVLTAGDRGRSQNFFVYRLRAVGDSGTCYGGTNPGADCVDASVCGVDADGVAGVCQIYRSSWAYSSAFRICPVDSAYQERRPE